MTAFDEAAARVAQGADARVEADALVAMMTLEEKLGCLSGELSVGLDTASARPI